LSGEQWTAIIGDLRRNFDRQTFVEINGGEPLIKQDLVLSVITELKKHFASVAMNSNGLLIRPEIIKKLEQAGLDLIKISFYSLDQATHNILRGHLLAYEKARAAIELVAASKIKLEIGILLTAKNIANVPELLTWLRGLPNVSIILQPLDESVESMDSKDLSSNKLLTDLWPEPNAVKKFFAGIYADHSRIKNSLDNIKAIEEYYLNPPEVLKYRCFAGQRNCVIYPNGDVAMCFKGKIVGNITKDSIAKILASPAAVFERKAITHCQKYCRIIGCNYSRGIKERLKL
jgi:MoaA/NifB/PqqE/SkfB family radical SAM enzyme